MATPRLTEREQLVLQAVVHLFVTTAEPVGSRVVVKRFGLDISAATVRNVMADLEEGGYLQQLHTSSGRVPTDRGYRYYVDYLMQVQDVTQNERARVEQRLSAQLNDSDEILRQTSYLLALISQQTSIVESPSPSAVDVARIEIVSIADRRVAFLLADTSGGVRTTVMQMMHEFSPANIQNLTRFLNDHLRGTSVDRVLPSLQTKLNAFVDEQRQLADQAIELLRLIPADHGGQLFLEGATQLFEQPEFHDVDKAREVFGLLEERDRVVQLLRAGVINAQPHSSRVVIGSEAHQEGFEELSVVSAPYKVGQKTVGMVGVLGPRRMPYSRLSGLVEYAAARLGGLLSRLAD